MIFTRKRFLLGAIGVTGFALLLQTSLFKTENGSNAPVVYAAVPQTSESCRTCHNSIFEAWQGTDHGLANRLPNPAEIAALKTFPGGLPDADSQPPLMILGHTPLWQPLIPKPGGRWQPHEIAYDPSRKDWFNVFAAENRQPGEWGHWTGRGMNWNSMCAQCHMTGYAPNYSADTDTYHSNWIEQGVGCVQCHGEQPAAHSQKPYNPAAVNNPFRGDRALMMQTCAPCHARNEALTSSFKPGDNYHDHYRVTLPTNAATFYPDGQQRDEDFNWTSVLLSRMGHAGVSCIDCHDPHTTKTILPVENNSLCLQCHAPPGRVMAGGTLAVPIDPVAHSHHADGSAGNSCVACHMPTTTYMQRAPRHDHGWLKPDPLLTKELGIPNACSRCHTDQSTDWLIEKSNAWYGSKLDSRQRARARGIAAAQAGQPSAPASLLALLAQEDIPAWRATYLDLLAPHAADPAIRTTAETSLKAASPLERAAAVRALGPLPDARSALRPLLKDPIRLVRLDAAQALTDELPDHSDSRRELDAYYRLTLDQPGGLTRIGLDYVNRGQAAKAIQTLEKAAPWDATSGAIRNYIAQIYHSENKPAEAADNFAQAAAIEPTNANALFNAGLAYAEAGRIADAENALRGAVKRDPTLDRAWYNLGLLLNSQGKPQDALEALARAEQSNPRSPDYPYAAATIHLRAGRREAAQEATKRALAITPDFSPALQLSRTFQTR
jgi:predicted CXXCH cytochrome family protein